MFHYKPSIWGYPHLWKPPNNDYNPIYKVHLHRTSILWRHCHFYAKAGSLPGGSPQDWCWWLVHLSTGPTIPGVHHGVLIGYILNQDLNSPSRMGLRHQKCMVRTILLTLLTVLLTGVIFLWGKQTHWHPIPGWGNPTTYLTHDVARRIYLDNTYCDPRFCQPPRVDVTKAILRRLKKKWPCIVFISSHAAHGLRWPFQGRGGEKTMTLKYVAGQTTRPWR
jgi:hypothetical protein